MREIASKVAIDSPCCEGRTCLPFSLPFEQRERLERLMHTRIRLKPGDFLYRHGFEGAALFAIRNGSFKTVLIDAGGREQITGFSVEGELLGFEGLSLSKYASDAIALEESEVCELPYAVLEQLGHEMPGFRRCVFSWLSLEITRSYSVMLTIGKLTASQRLAAFLLNLSERYAGRGRRLDELSLSMSREDLGSYLGLSLETASRQFSRLRATGAIEVKDRHVRILSRERLLELVA